MAGFSASWLSLREPVDQRSRDTHLQHKLSAYFQPQPFSADHPMRVLDLGCGTGSNLRALAPCLPDYQHWTLIDHDMALLQAARAELVGWAGGQGNSELSPLTITHGAKHIEVEFVQEDLALNIEHVLSQPAHLVTAAAFFDLVSPSWLLQFCASLRTPFFTVLIYNGDEQWSPAHQSDAAVLQAFRHHQHQDKGFGVAAGADATRILVEQLQSRSFDVHTAATPWLLQKPDDQALIAALASGTANAVRETAHLRENQIQQWLNRSLEAHQCAIGHWDVWATPPSDRLGDATLLA